jgi:hypothetical protein
MFWANMTALQAQQHGLHPDFFKFEEMDHQCRVHAPIIPHNEAHHLCCNDNKVLAKWVWLMGQLSK